MSSDEGRKIIDKIREEKIKEMLETGKHFIVTKEDIPIFQDTKEGVIVALGVVKVQAPKYGTTAEKVYADIKIHDVLSGKVYTADEFMSKVYIAGDESITKVVPEKKTELPEGVEMVKYQFATEEYAVVAEDIFKVTIAKKGEFRSAVNLDTKVRTVMYELDLGGKPYGGGSVLVMKTIDKETAWHLQQMIDWAYRKVVSIVAARREDKTVEVAFMMKGLVLPPPKEKMFFSFKKTDGWTLVGEEK